jgi:hypothetical protein
MMMPQIPSVFRLLPMHTTAIPHPEPPALGFGLELNPAAIDEYADGKSDPDFGNPSSAPMFVSNSNSSTPVGVRHGIHDHSPFGRRNPPPAADWHGWRFRALHALGG